MLQFPDSNSETEYTDPNGDKWSHNGTGWVRQPGAVSGGNGGPGWSHDNSSTVAFYDADNFSSANGAILSGQAITSYTYPWIRLSDTTFMEPFAPTAENGFTLWTSDGQRVIKGKTFPYDEQGTGIGQQGKIGNHVNAAAFNWNAVFEGEKCYALLGMNQYTDRHDLIEITESGVTLIAKPQIYKAEGDWKYADRAESCQYSGTVNGRPYLMRLSETEFVSFVLGESGTTKQPMIRASVISTVDSSVTENYFSDLPAKAMAANGAETFSGWMRDPRNPDHDAVCVLYWREYRPADTYWQLMVFHWAGESRTISTFDMGQCHSIYRMATAYEADTASWNFTGDDTIVFEVVGRNTSNTHQNCSYSIQLPSDRQDIANKTFAAMNYERAIKATTSNSYISSRFLCDRDATWGYISQNGLQTNLFNGTTAGNLNISNYGLVGKRDANNKDIIYLEFITSYYGKNVYPLSEESYTTSDSASGSGMISRAVSGLIPKQVHLGGASSASNVGVLGVIPNTGDIIANVNDSTSSVRRAMLVKRTPDPGLRLMARVEGGNVVEGPLKSREAGVDTTGSDWFPVKVESEDCGWKEKLDDGSVSFDADSDLVIWSRNVIPKTEEEMASEAIYAVESQFYPTDMTEEEIATEVQSQLNAVREALANADEGDLESLQRMEYQLETYLGKSHDC